MIALGSSEISKAYVGSFEVSKIYLGSELVYQNVVIPPDYLRFTALADGTFTFTIPADLSTTTYEYIEYSTDEGETWVKTENVNEQTVKVTTPTITTGNSVIWRGKGTNLATGSTVCCKFGASADFNASGYIRSLHAKAEESTSIGTYNYYRLFYNNTHIVDASGMILPKASSSYSYGGMFRGCTYLQYAPAINYDNMVANSSREMYYGCTRLKKIINYAKSSSATNAYTNWMYNVPTTCLLVANFAASDTFIGNINTRSLTYILYDKTNDKYYLSDRTTECDENGNVI